MAHQGWDSLTIDLQHGVIDYAAMVTMLQAISTTPTVPVVRVPWLEPGIMMKALDAGAYAVICPMVNTREDAQKLVAYTHYAPRGTRSFGPVRAALYGGRRLPAAGQRHHRRLRDDRDRAGAGQPGRDPVGGRAGRDLHRPVATCRWRWAARPVFDDLDPKAAQAIDHILERAKAHGVVAGIHNGVPEVALARVGQGLPLRHRRLRRAADGGRLAADPERDARAQA